MFFPKCRIARLSHCPFGPETATNRMLFPASDASTVSSFRVFRWIGRETPAPLHRTFNAFDWKTGITEDGDDVGHRQDKGREIDRGHPEINS